MYREPGIPSLVWDRRCRTRTMPGLSRKIPYNETGSSRLTLPLSTSCRTIVDANVFVSDARWYSVADVAGMWFSTSASPKPLAQTTSVPFAIAAENAGILSATRSCSRWSSNSATVCAGGRFGTRTPVDDEHARATTSGRTSTQRMNLGPKDLLLESTSPGLPVLGAPPLRLSRDAVSESRG